MKKIIFVMAVLITVSCREQEVDVSNQHVAVVNGRLAFKDLDQFSETLAELEQNEKATAMGTYKNLPYLSYYSMQKDHTLRPIESVLDLHEYQVLLNADRQVQIGERIYTVSEATVAVHSLQGELLETHDNEISHLDMSSKLFVNESQANGRQFGVYSTEGFDGIGTTEAYTIKYRWTRSRTGFLGNRTSYYYEATLQFFLRAQRAEYFSREISDCLAGDCSGSMGEYDGINHNTSSVRYFSGSNKRGDEHGSVGLRAVYKVKRVGYPERKFTHKQYLETP